MQSHEIDYEIHGNDMQVVAITLDPDETVIAEAGAMNWMSPRIKFETRMGDGSNPNQGFFGKLLEAGSRAISGESLFITHFTNEGSAREEVSFAAPYPGHIIPVDLNALGGSILCQRQAFLCAAKGTSISVAFTKRIGSGFFGGEGFVLQKLKGDGMAFIHAGGTVVKKELNNDTLLVDTGCIVGLSESLDFDIQTSGGLKSMLFGGEGIFLAKVSGTGTVWLQSMPFSRLANQIISRIPKTHSHND